MAKKRSVKAKDKMFFGLITFSLLLHLAVLNILGEIFYI